MSAKIDLINKLQEGNYLFVIVVFSIVILFVLYIELIKNLLVKANLVKDKKSVKAFLFSYALALATILALTIVYESFTLPFESDVKTMEIIK